ncbi:peptidase S14 ClpP [Pseudonocardia dioxanivorans CB1190]|uniref:ATP-dependent Clp protease proteolytic subunit n=1 Tax=Pseudonocardia dioxanivorans (strain ATCC 55486 / DSM 44775 / JCM 13855 / CB1190) TaxID=675635 RepID=F4D1C7_PSEUX|nr:head maturation protease, ClpP-related [Pseudonocardia dioxanivorans]AEA27915.1 peptidase S14 ClpP [Pseudonocardia dioxanivorans CB1190]
MTSRPAPRAGDRPPAWYRVGPVVALATAPADEQTEDETAPAEPASTADVYVFDTIGGWWGMTADDFVRDVATLDVDQIVLHLNSPGGDAFEGVAIANVLRAHRARVVVRVDGMAASAASVIAMAGDEVVMGIGSQMMVHDASGYTWGNAAEIEAFLRRLNATSDSLAGTYAARAGGTVAEWRAVMQAETWYTPEEAVAAGLADRVATADETGTAEGEQITPGASSSSWWDMWDSLRDQSRFDLTAFTYAGREHAPAPAMPGRQTPAASAAGNRTNHEERGGDVAFSDEQLTTMRQRLGLAADADEATITAAFEEALDERAEPSTTLPEGVVTIEAATLAELRAAARRGDEARSQQERDARVALVEAAIRDGRIAPARREHWLSALAADAGAAETLAGLEKGLIPVDNEIGHSGVGPSDSDADSLYATVFGPEA